MEIVSLLLNFRNQIEYFLMKPIIRQILFLLLFTGISTASLYAQENQSYFLHTIEKGQSLYSIAAMYGLNQEDIVQMNPGSNEKIYAGMALRIPKSSPSAQQKETFHTIQQGETLYKLTTIYNLSAKEITEANPGLSAENFRIGQVVRIPVPATPTTQVVVEQTSSTDIPAAVKSKCKDMHKVQRKETVFSVSRKYGITKEELIAANPELANGMKRGQFVCIPYTGAPGELTEKSTSKGKVPTTGPSNSELFSENEEKAKSFSTIKAAVLLPFQQDKRMVEYYEGFLLAVDSLKREGISLDIYAYNLTDTDASLNSILAKSEMKKMNIIFGPMQSKHTNSLAAFAKQNDITLVIPFSSKEDEVFSNPNVYLINTPQSYLYSEVYDHFTRQFTNANVILLDAGETASKNKREFIDGLKADLANKGVTYKALPEGASVEGLQGALVEGKENIFVPTSSSDVSLIKIIPQLTMLTRENPEYNISLFGYPEWQTYTKDHLDSFFELNTYFYSAFYTNNLLPSAVDFTNKYNRWYSKDMDNSYPKYGMLGFDTGYFFLKGLSLYGSEFEDNIGFMNVRPIQTGFNFKRVNNWGGFINKKAFFVNFSKDYELIKLDFE